MSFIVSLHPSPCEQSNNHVRDRSLMSITQSGSDDSQPCWEKTSCNHMAVRTSWMMQNLYENQVCTVARRKAENLIWTQLAHIKKKRLACPLMQTGNTNHRSIWSLDSIVVLQRCRTLWGEGGREGGGKRGDGEGGRCYNFGMRDAIRAWLATSATWRAGWQQSEAAVTSAWPLVVVVEVLGGGDGGRWRAGWRKAAVAACTPKGCLCLAHDRVLVQWVESC